MKKISILRIAGIALFLTAIGTGTLTAQSYSGGAGTSGDPYQLATAQDLLDLDTAVNQWGTANYYALTADIDMAGQTFYPIGYQNAANVEFWFKGHIDGQNHVISNLTITKNPDQNGLYSGLIGLGEKNIIKNLGLIGITIDQLGAIERVGALIGRGRWGCDISNCFVIDGTITGNGRVGGLVGYLDGVNMDNCFVDALVKDSWGNTGGFAGDCPNWSTNVLSNLVFYGIKENGSAIAGNGREKTTFSNCYYITSCGAIDTSAVAVCPDDLLLAESYDGFDFSANWVMKDGGYAVLQGFQTSAFDALVPRTGNSAPTAYAGADQNVYNGSMVTLDGSGSSDFECDALTYSWTVVDGAAITLSDAAIVNPTFTAPAVDVATDYQFRLVVNDGEFDSGADTVKVTVQPGANSAPVANAGPAQTVESDDLVTLDGSGSSDENDDALTYTWTPAEGITLSDVNSVNPTFTAQRYSENKDLTFTLVVNDGELDSDPSTVVITVNAFVNTPPVADAGDAQSVDSGDEVTLDGSGTDADEDNLTFTWTNDGGITLSDANAMDPTFTAPEVETATDITFTLVVNDGTDDSDPATVVVTVNPVVSVESLSGLDVSVYPNPSSGLFKVVVDTELQLEIRDIVGRIVYSNMLERGINTIDISTSDPGIYSLSVSDGLKNSSKIISVK